LRKSNLRIRILTDRGDVVPHYKRGGSRALRAVFVAALLVLSCVPARDGGTGGLSGAAGCRTVDSALAHSGWREHRGFAGRVTFDVKQYRVRGGFRMTAEADGDLIFEFAGNMVLGGHHEDVVLSWYGGELRILDRERGRLYEGTEADALIAEGLGEEWDVAGLIRLVTARRPECARLTSVRLEGAGDEYRLDGRLDERAFRLDFSGGRLVRASWPVTVGGGTEDRLEVTYRWNSATGGNVLSRLVLFLEGRRWRIKLES
jgi:hypothetical protein